MFQFHLKNGIPLCHKTWQDIRRYIVVFRITIQTYKRAISHQKANKTGVAVSY
jgi:hypothetical protein